MMTRSNGGNVTRWRMFLTSMPFVIGAGIFSSSSVAQVPVNNTCANAILVTCNSAITGTTISSTNVGAPGSCVTSLNTAGGVWYKVIGWNGDMTVSLCNSNYDTKIGVFSGVCGAFSCVKGNDDDQGLGGAGVCGPDYSVASSTSWTATAGVTYHIYVTGFQTNTGNFELVVTCGDTNFPCPENGLILEIQTDGNGQDISWEIIPEGLDLYVCRGSGYPDNAVLTANCCLPDGCYRLAFYDAGGDGIVGGGYILRTEGDNDRIIDNRNNFNADSVSAIANDQGFCLRIGGDRLIYTSCDKLDWVSNQFIVASLNESVSAEWINGAPNNQQSSNTGYEFWFFDPNGSYSFRWFRSHSTSHGFGTGAARAAHLRINNWLAAFHIPEQVLMNVRVRGRVNGVDLEWGPACRFMIDPVAAACPMTKLMDIPYNQFLSCGETRAWAPNSYVHARPVSGASQYEFRFRQPSEGYEVVRTTNSYFAQLWWGMPLPPLVSGSEYEVDVRAFKNGQWCPWGEVCTLNIAPAIQDGNGLNSMLDGGQVQNLDLNAPKLTMWPNPNQGDRFFIQVSNMPEHAIVATIDFFDLQGRRIDSMTLPAEQINAGSQLTLNGNMSAGVYLVNVTAGEKIFSQRLVIQ